MGSFLFKWDHPATEVHVTGTFDDWAKSVKLQSKSGHFEKLVDLPVADRKIYYKFVVDGTWTTDHTAPQETDESNNVNNVLLPENISKSHSLSGAAAAGIMSGVTPQSTTAQLAGKVPKESERDIRPISASSDMPGGHPETPFHEAREFAVDPIPETSGIGNPVQLAPGEKVPHPSTLTSNTISSTVRDDSSLEKSVDDSQQRFGVAPLPATSGIGNPISLRPGEKAPDPSSYTSNTISTTVTTDKDSYEKSGGAPSLPNVVTPERERDAAGGMFSMPGISKSTIPESSLPMGASAMASEPDPGYMIQSAGAQSTTAALAGNVPKEPRGVPEVVTESQHEAGVGPEASGNREAVKEKSAMEKELESQVPEEPPASEGTAGMFTGTETEGIAAGGTGAIAGTGAAAIHGSKGVVAGESSTPSHGLPASVQQSIDKMNSGSAIAPTVPDTVQKSITESHQPAEAAGSREMVKEKSAMESEFMADVKKDNSKGEPAPSSSAALTETAPAATGAKSFQTSTSAAKDTSTGTDSAPVTTAAAPAQTPATGNATQEAVKETKPDSRDISPMSKPTTSGQTQPMVTTGVGASSTPQTSQTPNKDKVAEAKPSPTASSSASADKKSKRSSGFFGKLKSRFSDKH